MKDATNGSTWLSCCGRCRNEMKSLYDCPPIPSLIFSVGAMMPPKRMMALMLKKYSALYLSSVSSVCHPRAPSATTCRASTARGWRAAGLTQASRHLPTLVVDELDRASRGTQTHHGRQQRQRRGVLFVVHLLHGLRHTQLALLEPLLDLQPTHLSGPGGVVAT